MYMWGIDFASFSKIIFIRFWTVPTVVIFVFYFIIFLAKTSICNLQVQIRQSLVWQKDMSTFMCWIPIQHILTKLKHLTWPFS
jgi:hypothetical protein